MHARLIKRVFNLFDRDVSWAKIYRHKYLKHTGKDFNYYETPIGNYYLPKLENDGIASEMRSGRFFEPEVIEIVKKYIQPGSIVLDVGANFGQMAIEFSKIA